MSHSKESALNTKEPIRYINKLIFKQPTKNYREYLQLTIKI